jgi:protein disulfide-isomerase A1
MFRSAVLCALALLLVGVMGSDVLDLNSATFESAIEDHPLIAVEFFAPWCGHCKSLAPEWEKVATEMKGKVPVAKVDCIENQEVCAEQEVQGYPTLKLFRSGEPSPMEVPRKAEAIVSFLTKEMEPSVHVLAASEVESFLETHPLTTVAYLENDQDERFEAFRTLANQKRHTLSFVAVIGAAQEGAEHQPPTIVLRRNFDEPKITYTGEFTAPAIGSWVSRNLLPILGEINGETFNGYVATELPIGYLFVDPNAAGTTDFLKAVEAKLAPFRGDFVVGWINNNKYAQQAERLGLSGRIPSLAIDNPVEGARYVFPDDTEVTAEALSDWFAQYKSGALKAHIKSEPIPESNDTPVKVVVAHTFKDIIEDDTKDVLVEFYAPWCGHCKKLAPIYDELGSLYSQIPSVVVAKIDATANDVPPKLNIRGFPTILLFKAGQKDVPVEYQGARTLDDMAKFIHTHASQQFELPTQQQQPQHGEHDEL